MVEPYYHCTPPKVCALSWLFNFNSIGLERNRDEGKGMEDSKPTKQRDREGRASIKDEREKARKLLSNKRIHCWLVSIRIFNEQVPLHSKRQRRP